MIAWVRSLWNTMVAWLTGKKVRRTCFKGVVILDPDLDPEREIRKRKLVLIGSHEKVKWLRFSCPCQCGDVIALNLMGSHSPHWKVEMNEDNTITVHPSVDATSCGSHFWIRRNRIQWV